MACKFWDIIFAKIYKFWGRFQTSNGTPLSPANLKLPPPRGPTTSKNALRKANNNSVFDTNAFEKIFKIGYKRNFNGFSNIFTYFASRGSSTGCPKKYSCLKNQSIFKFLYFVSTSTTRPFLSITDLLIGFEFE